MADAALEFSGVSFSYGSHRVLSDVNLTVRRGDFLALLGHNGSGKSTLLKIALGLLRAQEGSVRFFGQELDRFSRWEEVGYVQQYPEEFDFQFPATAMEVVLMGRLAKKRGLLRGFGPEDHLAARKAMEDVGMGEVAGRKIGALSGGQRQRVFLAKALCSDAKILFLDEPTTAMDYASQHAFYDTLQKLNIGRNITIVLVTHDIGQVLQHAKRVALLDRRIIFEGEPEKFDRNAMWNITERV